MVAAFHVHADLRGIPVGTGLRSLGAAVADLASGEVHCVRMPLGGGAPLDRHLETGAGVLVVLVDGQACSYWGQLHPFRIDSSRLALDAIAAAVRALPRPSGDSAPSWLKEVVVDASLRAYGVSMGSLGSTLALTLLHGDKAQVAHVGDVVVSLARRAESYEIVELTADHTLLRQMRESGTPAAEIEEAQQAFAPDKVLTRGFGYGWDPEPEVCEVAVAEGDLLVLSHRSFVREVIEQVPIDRDIRAGDKGIWHRLWLDEAARRDARSPALVFAERTAP